MRAPRRLGTVVSLSVCLAGPAAAQAEGKAPPQTPGRLELPKEQASWSGEIPPGGTLEVKSLVGRIRFEQATGTAALVEIRRVVPPGVEDDPVIHVVTHEKGVTICPVYPSTNPKKPNECIPGRGKGRMKSELWEKGVTFEYVVHVPAGVSFAAETTTGEITGTLLESDVDVKASRSEILVVTGRNTKAEGLGPVTVRLAPSTVERRIDVRAMNNPATVLFPPRTRYSYSVSVLNGQIRAADGPKIETLSQIRKASKTGGPSSGPLATVSIDTINGDAVLALAPD